MNNKSETPTRRDFLKTTGVLAAGSLVAGTMAPKVHAAGSDVIKVAMVGCGGRGRGAVKNAISADPGTKLVALADAFEDKANAIAGFMKKEFGDRVDTEGRVFSGLDSYKKAMDCLGPGDVVVFATPPAFRPLHFAYAVEKGLNIFAEKPLAVDAPGCRKMLELNEKAKEKGLKVAVGLNNRHYLRTEETVKKIQDGMIGDVVSCWVYRLQQEMSLAKTPDKTAFQHQLLNHNGWTWSSGSFMVDWMIHNVDVCCWARKEMWPVSVEGQGGRQTRTFKDQMFDHCAYEYRFEDGVKMMVQLRQIPKTWMAFRAVIHGSKGCAVVGEGVRDPIVYKTLKEANDNILWKSGLPGDNSYQKEHDRLFKAIRDNKEWNEVDRGVRATFTSIAARMAVDSGQELQLADLWESKYEMTPGIENWTIDGEPPVKPDENGNYALPVPGVTKQY